MGEKGIKNSRVTLFNRLLTTNQTPSQVDVAKFRHQSGWNWKKIIGSWKKRANFLLLGVARWVFFKAFLFVFDEITPVLPIRQFFDLLKLCDWNGIRILNHLVQK